MFNWISAFIDRVFVVIGAIVFAQLPNFFQDYTQRLGGHLSELQIQVASMRQAAETSGKTLDEYLSKFMTHADADIVNQGELMNGMVSRFADLSESYTSLIHASILSKPFLFMKSMHLDIAKMTLSEFQPGLTLTVESGVYALLGLGFGYVVFIMARQILRAIGKGFGRVLKNREINHREQRVHGDK